MSEALSPAVLAPRTPSARPLTRGFGLLTGAAASLGLWAALGWAVAAFV